MRTIKFKGKCLIPKNGKETAYGSLLMYPDGTTTIFENIRASEFYCIGVAPTTVCQFTGFHDKNGKEIYEGDVLRSDEYPFSSVKDGKRDNYFGIVFYSEEGAAFGIMAAKNHEFRTRGIFDGVSYGISQDKLKDFEVIGNIHEEEWKQYREYVQTEEEKEAKDD